MTLEILGMEEELILHVLQSRRMLWLTMMRPSLGMIVGQSGEKGEGDRIDKLYNVDVLCKLTPQSNIQS